MNRLSLQCLSLTAVGAFLLVAGCQFPQSRGGGLAGWGRGDKSFQLNSHQVVNVQLSMARSLEQKGELERAHEAYVKVAETEPKCAEAWWRQAVVCDKRGKNKESEPLYRKALKLDAKNAELHCDFGYSLYLQRRWVEAENELRQAVTLEPKNPRAHTNLGLVLAQTERTNEALAEFHKAGCDESDAHANLALILALNHRNDDALRAYETARALRPKSDAARQGIAALQSAARKAPADSSVRLVSHESESPAAADAPRPLRLKTPPAKSRNAPVRR